MTFFEESEKETQLFEKFVKEIEKDGDSDNEVPCGQCDSEIL